MVYAKETGTFTKRKSKNHVKKNNDIHYRTSKETKMARTCMESKTGSNDIHNIEMGTRLQKQVEEDRAGPELANECGRQKHVERDRHGNFKERNGI